MGRNTGKRHSKQDQEDSSMKTSKDHSSGGSSNRPATGRNQSEQERNQGKEGGARTGKSPRTGSSHEKD